MLRTENLATPLENIKIRKLSWSRQTFLETSRDSKVLELPQEASFPKRRSQKKAISVLNEEQLNMGALTIFRETTCGQRIFLFIGIFFAIFVGFILPVFVEIFGQVASSLGP